MITAANLHRSYSIGKKSIEILHGVDLHIAAGEKVFLCGPSGAGKTTLMYTLAGLETPQEGKVTIDGTDIYALSATARSVFRNRNMGFIFQNYLLMPELTALENACLASSIGRRPRVEYVTELMARVGLSHRLNHLPSELSGGEQQRVAIAAPWRMTPRLFLQMNLPGTWTGRTARRCWTFCSAWRTNPARRW